MSRIGKQIINVEKGVEVSVSPERQVLVRSGGKSMQIPLHENLELKQENGKISISRKSEDKKTKSLHGLSRVLIQNAIIGVSKGWSKGLELNGVGYRASVSGKNLELNLGYSHPITHKIPEDINVKVDKQTKILIEGKDKELVGRVAYQIRNYRPVEPYLGKGVKYTDEVIRRKAGKSGGGEKKA